MTLYFGPWKLNTREIFFVSKYSYGIVNLKPVVPGHVLVIPKRIVKRFADLSAEEVSDMFLSAQEIGKVIEREFKGESLTITVQDGESAGQTVPHVHVHLIPRVKGDWMNNDDIYSEINKSERDMNAEKAKVEKGPDNEARVARTMDEMAAEANMLKLFFKPYENV